MTQGREPTRRRLGGTTLEVFPLAFGDNVIGWTTDRDASFAVLDAYVEAGRTDRGRAAYDLLIEVLSALHKDGEITGRLQAIVERDDKNAFAKLVLAGQHAKADNLDEAAKLYERSLVLVRPDGHVAWRGDQAPADALSVIVRVRGA